MAKLTKASISLLGVIVASMQNEDAPYHMATKAEVKNLLDNDMVEVNEEIADGDKVAVRATEKGVAEASSASEGNTNNVTSTTTNTAAPSFDLIDGAELPEGRASRGSSTYPFEQMNEGQSFFIPATEEKPNPSKSMASTVSSANKRFRKEGADGRQFSVKAVKGGQEYGSFKAPSDGALVKRVK